MYEKTEKEEKEKNSTWIYKVKDQKIVSSM